MSQCRTLADVPKNPFGLNSPVRFSEVSSFTDLSKKKCSEIVSAVDNHGIGIYDVSTLQFE